MLKNFGSWLGLASPTTAQPTGDTEELIAEKEEKVVEAQNEVNKPQPTDADGDADANQDTDHQGKGLSGKLKKYPRPSCSYSIMQGHASLKALFTG